MLSPEPLDRIHVALDDHRLAANAGMTLAVTLAHRLGLGELEDDHVDLGDAPVRANAADKLLTLMTSALARGDDIDDDALRAGGTEQVLGRTVKAPSTPVMASTSQQIRRTHGSGGPGQSLFGFRPWREWSLRVEHMQRGRWNPTTAPYDRAGKSR